MLRTLRGNGPYGCEFDSMGLLCLKWNVLHVFTVILHNCRLLEILAQQLVMCLSRYVVDSDVDQGCVFGRYVIASHDALRALVDMLLIAMLIKGVSLVMSTLAHFDSKIISQTDGAQSFRVPTLLPDDPYVTAHAPATIDTESEPEEALLEIEEFLLLVYRAPLTDEEFEASKQSDTRTTLSHSSASLKSTAPLLPDHPLTQTSLTPIPTRVSFHHRTTRMIVCAQPAMSLGLLARVTEAMTFSDSTFRKR
ncbi:hypothetical protein Tco_0776620 [Tanacetum coccineum]